MKRLMFLGSVMLVAAVSAADYPIRSAEMTKVRVTRGFWFDRLETNRLVTLKADLAKCNETPRIANFTNAANRAAGTFGGLPFDDSDVYKVMEGAAYIYAQHPDPKLREYVDWFISQVAKAQEADGYLYTARTLAFYFGKKETGEIDYGWMGPDRFSRLESSHELYNVGHMYEAAVAWYQSTGERNFLDVAVRNADFVYRTFGPEPYKLHDVPGHQEIELALVKLYRVTGETRYLDLAQYFLETRGNRTPREGLALSVDRQEHLPVLRQDEACGHAVRACYMYSAMCDVAALTGEAKWRNAVDRLWENVVGRKMHLSGGVGEGNTCHPKFGNGWEAFGNDYSLPNETAYLETCAAIAHALWQERLFRMTGAAKYVDVLERILCNGFLSGISISGDEFFYPNPLANKTGLGHAKKKPYVRSKWFGCSCCPVNDVRFIPQVPSFAYATNGEGTLYWNLFMEGEAEIAGVKLSCKTDYPWNGKATLTVGDRQAQGDNGLRMLKVRIPGWAKGRPVPSDLYTQTVPSSVMEVAVLVNGLAVNGVPGKDGYLTIGREWKSGDVVEVNLPMPVKRIRAHEKVEADRGRLAVERGPIVYCAEGCDNDGKAYDAVLPADATFTDDRITIGGKVYPALKASNGLKLIPYCLWGNREPGNEMQVWFKTSAGGNGIAKLCTDHAKE